MYPHNLSRGMRLKLGILMALMRPFKVILMDEPTSALDVESVSLIREKLIMLQNNGCAILITSHDLNTAGRIRRKNMADGAWSSGGWLNECRVVGTFTATIQQNGFWTTIVGYDPQDHSLSHRIYLIYVVIFFSLWWFAVLALIADWVARIFLLLKAYHLFRLRYH